jgi:hypothetical protein
MYRISGFKKRMLLVLTCSHDTCTAGRSVFVPTIISSSGELTVKTVSPRYSAIFEACFGRTNALSVPCSTNRGIFAGNCGDVREAKKKRKPKTIECGQVAVSVTIRV